MDYITIVCLLKLAMAGATAQRVVFEVLPDHVADVTESWSVKPTNTTQFKKMACAHVGDLTRVVSKQELDLF